MSRVSLFYQCLGVGVSWIVLFSPLTSAQVDAAIDLSIEHQNQERIEFGENCAEDMICLYTLRTKHLSVIEVLGDRYLEAPGAVSGLSESSLRNKAADHPAEVLNTLPGVNIHLNSGQEHLIALRSPVLTGGAGQGSFLVMENGVPIRSPAFGNVNLLLDPHHELAQAIEVVRGPGSAKYGSNAVHGLMNFIHPDIGHDEWGRVSYGSLGRYRGDLSIDATDKLRVGLSLQKDTGWRDATDLNQQKMSVIGEYALGDLTVQPWMSITNLEQETAGFIQGENAFEDEEVAKSNPNPEANRNANSARAAVRVEGNNWSIVPYIHTQSMQFRQHFLPYNGVEKNGHTGGGVMGRTEWQPSDNLTARLGADIDIASGFLKETQEEPFGFFPDDSRFPQGVHYDYTVDTQAYALWSEVDWSLTDRLSALLGLRLEAHDYDYSTDAPVGINGRFNVPANRSDDFGLATPKVGLIWQGDDVSYFANYARGQRAPQASDLYRLQSLQVPGEIDEETLDSFEIGARGTAFDDRFVFDVAAYWAEKDNFFFRDSDGLNVTDGSTRHKGIEAAARFDFSDNWHIAGQLSWSDQIYTFDREANGIVDGNPIDTAPEWLGDFTFGYRADSGLRADLSAEYIGEYTTNPAATRFYDGHTVFNARIAVPLPDDMEASVIIRNLTDELYADRADFAFGSDRFFPGEPLNVTVGLKKDF